MFDNKKNYFMFFDLYLKEYFLVIFTCFFEIVLKNNYINMKNN